MKNSDHCVPSVDLPLGANASLILLQRSDVLARRVSQARRRLSSGAIHDLRVASRRFREALAVFEELIGGGGYRKLRRMARRLTRWPGEVRNLDVKGGVLDRVMAEQPQTGAALAAGASKERLPRDRRRARRLLARRIGDFDLEAFEVRAAKFAGKLLRRQLQQLSPDMVRGVLEARLDAIFRLKRRALAGEDPLAQHRLRIALKKLRYGIETLQFALGDGAAVPLARITSFQTALGEIHDIDVLMAELKGEEGAAGGNCADLLRALGEMRRAQHEKFVVSFRSFGKAGVLSGLLRGLQT